MKVVIQRPYIKAKENVQDGDIITLLNEGKWEEMVSPDGQKKKVLQFKAKLPDGEEKTYTMNVTTQKNMVLEWGDDTKEWVGKSLRVWIVRQLNFGKMADVLILTPKEWSSPIKDESESEDGVEGEPIDIEE